MKIKSLLIGLVLMAGISVQAQTNAPAPTIQSGIQSVIDAFKAGQTNWWGEVHGLYAPGLKSKYGGGAGLFWNLSQYVYTGVRVDYIDGDFWMPSGSATAQLPVQIFSWLKVSPIAYVGIGIPISGATIASTTLGAPARDNNDQPTAILGYGFAVEVAHFNSTSAWIPKNIALIGDREEWTGFTGQQYRFGVTSNWTF